MHLACPCDDFVRRSASFGWQPTRNRRRECSCHTLPHSSEEQRHTSEEGSSSRATVEIVSRVEKLTACGKSQFSHGLEVCTSSLLFADAVQVTLRLLDVGVAGASRQNAAFFRQ